MTTTPAHFIIGIESTELNHNDRRRLIHPSVVGCILFARNFADAKQLKALTKSIRALRSDLIVSIDHEGGRVQRLRGEGFTDLSAPHSLDNASIQEIELHATTMCKELQAVGIDLNYVPVVDRYSAESRIIQNRAFSDDFAKITEIASYYITSMHANKMPATLKHFPGHGAVLEDTHLETSVDNRCYEQITETDLTPFVSLIAQQKADAVMISHIRYPQVDAKIASMSHFWITGVLRNTLGFDGIVFSDDLDMKAVSADYSNVIAMCNDFFNAGGDVALICNQFEQIDDALAYYQQDPNAKFQSRWYKFLSRLAPQY